MHMAFRQEAAGKRVIAMAWLGMLTKSKKVAEISNIVWKAPQVNVWIIGAQLNRKRQPQSVMRLAGISRDQCAGSTVAVMVQAPLSFSAGAAVAASGCFKVKTLVITLWTLPRLAMPPLPQLANPRRRGVHRTAR